MTKKKSWMTSSSSPTRRPMPTYLYAGMLAASNRQVQVLDASSATSKVGMPHPSAQQHGVNSSTHASSEQVFNDTIASHLEFPYFFSASSRARVTTLEPGNHRRVPPPSLDQPSGWLFPLTTRHNSCSIFKFWAAADILKDCCQLNILPGHIPRPTLPGRISRPVERGRC